MVDPVNLNVPGLPYLLFAAAFFAVVFVLMWVLSPLELLIRRQQQLNFDLDRDLGGDAGDGENDGSENDASGSSDADGGIAIARFPSDDAITPTIDGLFGTVREPSSPVVYECRHCGTTLGSGDERCPRCETASVVRYETR